MLVKQGKRFFCVCIWKMLASWERARPEFRMHRSASCAAVTKQTTAGSCMRNDSWQGVPPHANNPRRTHTHNPHMTLRRFIMSANAQFMKLRSSLTKKERQIDIVDALFQNLVDFKLRPNTKVVPKEVKIITVTQPLPNIN